MMHDGMYGFWGMGWLWWILILVFIGLIIWTVVRSGSRNVTHHQGTARETSLEILERRYANGEISTEEYRERKKELTGKV